MLTCLQRVANFNLDTALRDACKSDLQNKCQKSLADIDASPEVRSSALKCLQQFKEELDSDLCKAEVHRRMVRAGSDIRFADNLASACQADRARLCKDVQPVG